MDKLQEPNNSEGNICVQNMYKTSMYTWPQISDSSPEFQHLSLSNNFTGQACICSDKELSCVHFEPLSIGNCKETLLKLEAWNSIPEISVSLKRRDSVVGIAAGYGLDDRGIGVRVPVGPRIFSSPCSLCCLWGRPNLLPNGYRGLLLRG
jgi:hypothetical protein